jgi:hypothetical protein
MTYAPIEMANIALSYLKPDEISYIQDLLEIQFNSEIDTVSYMDDTYVNGELDDLNTAMLWATEEVGFPDLAMDWSEDEDNAWKEAVRILYSNIGG